MLEKLEDAGIIASKSEGVRNSLSEWLLIHIDVLNDAYRELGRQKTGIDVRTERLWNAIAKLIDEYDASWGGLDINAD